MSTVTASFQFLKFGENDGSKDVLNGEAWDLADEVIAAISQFAEDRSVTRDADGNLSGLTFGWLAGQLRADNLITPVAAGSLVLTASQTNYIEVSSTGVVSANTTGFTAGRYPLFEVVCDAAAMIGITDRRAWLAASGTPDSSIAMVKVAELDEDPATTTGLTWGYQAGRIRNQVAVTDVAAGTVALTDNVTNYVEITGAGTVTVNTVGFTTGRIPLRQVTTASGSQTVSTDKRAFFMVDNDSGASSGLTDFDQDAGTTTGLTWGYKAGTLRRGNLITPIGAGTGLLTDNSTNYVELDPTDQTVKANQTGFTAGRIPLRQVTTVSGSQAVDGLAHVNRLFAQVDTGQFIARAHHVS